MIVKVILQRSLMRGIIHVTCCSTGELESGVPFEVIESPDPYAALIDFRTSAVYEMVIGIRALLKPTPAQELWLNLSQVSTALRAELSYLYNTFNDGILYHELPVDYTAHQDVPGFLDYILNLSETDFLFYLVGRSLPREHIRSLLTEANVVAAFQEALSETDYYTWYAPYLEPILANVGGFQRRLVAAWESYWTGTFNKQVNFFRPIWTAGIQEKRSILAREGGRALLEKVTGRPDLPPEFPIGVPITSITLIPICLLPSRVYRFYGYGNITILFDPQYTEERRLNAQHTVAQALATIKALDDPTRLDILRLIAQKSSLLHGKMIAEQRGISASAVSRHLALLKEGGLISEDPHKNLITYRFNKEVLVDFAEKLMDYLYS
jgi:DNA-binding transcriptional ArsR family regulator